jgi:hypothetical protein
MSDKTKEARLEQITNIFDGIRYPSTEHKKGVIESLANSEVDIELVRSIANDLKRTQGFHHAAYR